MTTHPPAPPRSSPPGAATSPSGALPTAGGFLDMDDLITKAKAVASLWDLMLFSSGNAAARQKRADVMHMAVLNLQAALGKRESLL